jgi:TRAP transporter TAXI family solute receptor
MLIRGFLVSGLVVLGLTVGGCSKPAASPAGPHVLRMAATTAEDADLKAAISRLPDISVRATTQGGASITSLFDLQQGRTDMGIALADVAYLAFTGQLEDTSAPFTELRGMAMLDVNTFHFLVAPHTNITSISQLKGRRVALGPTGTSTALTAEMLIKAYGVDLDQVHGEQVPYPEATERLVRGDFDAAFMTQIVGSTPVTDAIRGGARLLDVDGPLIEELRRQRPFLRRTLIAKDAYPGLTKSVRTLGVDRVMICRADVDEDVVFRLLEAYFATPAGATPRADLERAPATPLPLHPGAARYYRQRELSR